MSFTEVKRQGYSLQRGASLGAAITLVSGCGEFTALFESATKCAEVLGDRALNDIGDGIIDVIPQYKIPTQDLQPALSKLTKKFSVALVEYCDTPQGGKFVPLWRINPVVTPPSTNLDDY